MLGILTELDEKPLRVMGDSSLSMDIEDMNKKLQQWPDDNICSMHDIQMKTTTLIKNYLIWMLWIGLCMMASSLITCKKARLKGTIFYNGCMSTYIM